jgi:formamidopyrimidine-DNA glycosylase
VPELPEVEITRRQISPHLVGRRITRVRTTAPSYFFLTPPRTLTRRLKGRTITALVRKGKYLLGELDDGRSLLLHLGMTGQLFTESAQSLRLLSSTSRGGSAHPPEAQPAFKPDAHTHLVFDLEGPGERVLFRDVRKFGKVKLLEAGEIDPRIEKLGPDALNATGEQIFSASRSRKVAIKSLLLDQSVLAGCGNIYADECLFLACVRPGRAAKSVTRAECEGMASGLRQVLERSIETGGSSISDYVQPDGSDGGFQDERKVYARTGEACLTCGAEIVRKVIGQRSSHYCPQCQH